MSSAPLGDSLSADLATSDFVAVLICCLSGRFIWFRPCNIKDEANVQHASHDDEADLQTSKHLQQAQVQLECNKYRKS